MKLAGVQEAGEVQVVAPGVQRTFQIHNNIKSFRILSDGLYSDKITAVIRELSCNAWDSHVAAGKKDVPFEVHFPTGLEAWFSVRDYGIGLCEDDIYNLYTTYFSSSKDQSNDFIGALGLGSKSPFSYCETFTVTSIFGGKKMIFSAYISEEGLPTIVKLHEEDTTEGNGLEVKFPVKRDDITNFHYKGARVFEFFKVTPKNNISGYSIPKNIYILEGNVDGCWWGIRAGSGNARAIMGSIAYPLDMVNQGLSMEEQTVASCGIDIEFNLGDLEIAASREKLSFNKATTAVVTQRYGKIFEQMKKQIFDKIDSCKTIWDARKTLFVLYNDPSSGRVVRSLVDKNLVKGKYTNFDFDGRTNSSFKATEYPNINIISVVGSSGIWPKKSVFTSEYKCTIEATEKQRFILNDMPRGHNQILASLVNDGSRFLMLAPKKDADPDLVEDEIQAFMSNFEGAKLETITDHKDLLAKKVPGEKKPRIRKNYFSYTPYSTWSLSFEHIDEKDFDSVVKDDALYFPIFKMKPSGDLEKHSENANEFRDFINLLRNSGILSKDQQLIAYKVKDEDDNDILDPENDLMTVIKERIEEKLSDPKIASYYYHDNGIAVPDIFTNSDLLATRNAKQTKEFFETDFGKLMLEYNEYRINRNKYSEFVRLCYVMRIEKKKDNAFKTMSDSIVAANKKYPMIHMIQSWHALSNITEIVDYLNLVDSK